jgi:hypothetical protein
MPSYLSHAASAAWRFINTKSPWGVFIDLIALFGVPVLTTGAAVQIGVDPGGAQALGILVFLAMLAYDTVRFWRWIRRGSCETRSRRQFRRRRSELDGGEE